jgi:hypothetical protein
MAGFLALQQRGQGHVEAFSGLPTGAVRFATALSQVRSAAHPWPRFALFLCLLKRVLILMLVAAV